MIDFIFIFNRLQLELIITPNGARLSLIFPKSPTSRAGLMCVFHMEIKWQISGRTKKKNTNENISLVFFVLQT
jgi:hypothetical protein